jgi:DNA-3-methyladenine glycosylase II
MTRATRSRLTCSIELPAGFRVGDVLAFHGRDSLQVAERISADSLQKGILWEGRAACLTIGFERAHAAVELAVDGRTRADEEALARLVRRMLGLTQPVAEFERAHRTHPQLGPLLERQRGLRVPLAATPFEALSWAITGQQISVGVAISLRRKLIEAAGVRHSGGLACHPDAARVAQLSAAELRGAGFSQAKAQTLVLLGSEVAAGRLPLDDWVSAFAADEIREGLLRLRGIGPWTVDYALLRGFGWVDGSLHGDVAVRRKLQQLLGAAEKVDAAYTERWLAQFAPWRALVAAHLWAMPAALS